MPIEEKRRRMRLLANCKRPQCTALGTLIPASHPGRASGRCRRWAWWRFGIAAHFDSSRATKPCRAWPWSQPASLPRSVRDIRLEAVSKLRAMGGAAGEGSILFRVTLTVSPSSPATGSPSRRPAGTRHRTKECPTQAFRLAYASDYKWRNRTHGTRAIVGKTQGPGTDRGGKDFAADNSEPEKNRSRKMPA